MKTTAATLIMIFWTALGFLPLASADVVIPGMGSGAYDVPSVGGPGDAVDKAPVCDNRSRPKITKVAPDTMKPGDKVTITGENFGKKECFHGVFFGSGGASGAATSYQLVNETTIEATVPDVKIGLGKLNVVTSGGSAQAIILLQAK